MNIIVLGAGSFGTAVGNELSANKLNQVCLFSRNDSKVKEINKDHTNVAESYNNIGLVYESQNKYDEALE